MIYPYRQDDQHLVKDLQCSLSLCLNSFARCLFLFIPALLILNIMIFCISPETPDIVIVYFLEDSFESTRLPCSLHIFSIFTKFLMIFVEHCYILHIMKSNQKSFIFDAITIFKYLDYRVDAFFTQPLKRLID